MLLTPNELQTLKAYRVTSLRLLAEQRPEEAEVVARAALAIQPDEPVAAETLAKAVLMQGRWTEGWELYEQRPNRLHSMARGCPWPEWAGEPLDGKRILVWGEQGLGDEIMFSRFIRQLRDLGATQIVAACHNPHVRTFQQVGADQVIARHDERVVLPPADYWTNLGSLPFRLGVTMENLSGAPYLSATPSRRGGIGLVERGNPQNPTDRDRSAPDGLLQEAVPQGRLITPTGDTLDSLALVAGLDLLITVDTSWAHMAGALGVPCWVLLPYRNLDWRWLRQGDYTPWYDSVRLFRQPALGDWPSVLAAVRSALRRD